MGLLGSGFLSITLCVIEGNIVDENNKHLTGMCEKGAESIAVLVLQGTNKNINRGEMAYDGQI